MLALGTVRPGSTIYIPFATYDGGTGASITMSGLALGDMLVYKDGGITQRASTAGFTLLDTDGIDFDAVTGLHGVSIDLADNTTAGFWAAGSKYFLAISTITVDGQTVSFLAATWDIGYPAAVLNTTIATLASQTSFTLTSGPAEDDALNNMTVVIHDVASAVQLGQATISDYTGATKTVTLSAGTTFTAAATDNVSVFPASGGGGGLDAAGVRAAVGLASANLDTQLSTIDDFLDTEVAAIKTKTDSLTFTVAGKVDANVTHYGGTAGTFASGRPEVNTSHWGGTAVASANVLIDGAITAAKIAADAITDAKVASDVTIASVTGAVGSVTGAVGSVTGNVGGNVTGSVGSIATGGIAAASFAAGAIDAAAIATDAIGSAELAASAITEIQAGLSTLDAAGVRTAVGLASANLDTQLSTIDDFLDTEVAAIKAKTDLIPAAGPADAAVYTSTRAGYLDELAAANIPADLDQVKADLPSRVTKNTALSAFMFMMVDSTDHVTAETGLTVTATRSIDGAAFASCANAVSEVANGWYKIDLAAADLNGNVVALRFTATGADTRNITIVTQP